MNSQRLRLFWLAGGITAALATLAASPASAPVDAARALLQDFRSDPARIDRARDLLEAAVSRDEAVDTRTLVTLSRAWFLYGENRAASEEARLAAYDRGRVVAERAIARAPGDAEAHLWCAINLGSWAQIKGLVRSLLTLQNIRREVETVLRLDPGNVDAHVMAGSLDREVPAILGGDKAKAEEHFKTARKLAPHLTGARIELAKLYIKMDRLAEARQELQGVLDEATPTDRSRWELTEVPQARVMLRSLGAAP
jgi:tetratricopeptide (TPR) repeat protein